MAEGVGSADIELRPAKRRGHRQDAAAERLAEDEDVGDNTVMLAGEEAPCLAQPCRDLVEDQERAVAVASVAYRLPESGRRA